MPCVHVVSQHSLLLHLRAAACLLWITSWFLSAIISQLFKKMNSESLSALCCFTVLVYGDQYWLPTSQAMGMLHIVLCSCLKLCCWNGKYVSATCICYKPISRIWVGARQSCLGGLRETYFLSGELGNLHLTRVQHCTELGMLDVSWNWGCQIWARKFLKI